MKINKHYITFGKIVVLLLSFGYIFYRLLIEKQSGDIINKITTLHKDSIMLFTIVLILTFFNWSIEAIKWQFLLQNIESIKFLKSLQSIFSGITVSIFTPNRIGEFGGRIFYLEEKNRASGIVATLMGNLSQLLITILVGAICLPFFLNNNIILPIKINNSVFFTSIIVVILVGFYVYFKASEIAGIFARYKKLKFVLKYFEFIKQYKNFTLLKVVSLSALRYLIFTSQFIILLNVFEIKLDYLTAFVAISQVYLIMSIIPTFALAELGVRGSVAVLIIGLFSNASIGILSASIVLWFFNLAIPAIIGSIFIYKLKI
ncbi:MAG: hypothetical protein JEZ09_12300 [Salinivirgaceae bacterium]|nr:hypothetical protein [Salinivirgaceae bacterium]